MTDITSTTPTHPIRDAGRQTGPRSLTWWLRVVGVFYLLRSVGMVFVKAPIRSFGPDGALARADAGDPVAEFLV
ncbi:MAG: hypothetical protein ACRD0S_12250, partial [Acidimicrobiales bacterium]